MPTQLKHFVDPLFFRFFAACCLGLALCGTASAQNYLNCPLTSNVDVTNSAPGVNAASVCLVGDGLTLSISSGAYLFNSGPDGGNGGTILNEGTINNAGVIYQAQDTVYNAGGTLLNSGEVGNGVVLNTGLIENETGGSLVNVSLTNAVSGTVTNYGSLNGTLTNAGTIYNLGATIELTGVSPTNTNSGTIQNFSGASITVDGGTSLTNNGTIINNLGATITNGGQLVNSEGATITNNGAFTAKGPFANYGTFSNAGGAEFYSLDNSGQIMNQISGVVDIGSGGAPSSVNTGSIINNGYLGISGLSDLGQLQNNGTLAIGDGSLAIQSGVNVVNNGSIYVFGSSGAQGGGVIIGVASTLTDTAGSSFVQYSGNTYVYGTLNSVPAVQLQGGTLLGTGTINGNVINSGGFVQPGAQPAYVSGMVPGTLTINGNYTQGSFGALDVELLTAYPGGFGLLDVTGLATVDGTVDFFAYPGFTPIAGEDLTFLQADSLAGEFASIDFEGWNCPTGDCSTLSRPAWP